LGPRVHLRVHFHADHDFPIPGRSGDQIARLSCLRSILHGLSLCFRSTFRTSREHCSQGLALPRLQLGPELLFLVLDEPADHLPPERLAQIRWQAPLFCSRADAVDDLLVAPRHVGFLLRGELELPGPLHVAEPFGDEVDERRVYTVYLSAHLGHVGAFFWSTRAHRLLPPFSPSPTIDRALGSARRPPRSHGPHGTACPRR